MRDAVPIVHDDPHRKISSVRGDVWQAASRPHFLIRSLFV